MHLDDLKLMIKEKNEEDMKAIYEQIKRDAFDSTCSIFVFDGRHKERPHFMPISEKQMDQLKKGGYEVSWNEAEVTVSGW